jgi:hypothetical protein
MKKLLYMLILPVLMLACEKYPMPGSETLESFNYNDYWEIISRQKVVNILPMELGYKLI